MIIKRIVVLGVLGWLPGCSTQFLRTPASVPPLCPGSTTPFLNSRTLAKVWDDGQLDPQARVQLDQVMGLPPPKRLRQLIQLIKTPEDFDTFIHYCTRDRVLHCDRGLVAMLQRAHPLGKDLDWVLGEPLAYALEKETRSAKITQLYRPRYMTLKEWESIPPEEQYRRLLNSRSADLQKTHEGFSFLGELKKEDYEVAEVTHARFTLSRDQLKAQIQAIENLFKERRGFHVHISFPEEHIEQVAPFFVWHQMANLWILLMNAKAGLVGDAPTGLPNKDLLKDAVENPPLESLCCAKFGGLGFRHNFLSGGKNYQVYQSPRAGLELRDAGSGTEEILAMVDWVRGSVLNQSWKRWQLDRNQTRQVLMHHHPQNEDSVILGTGTQTEALFLREYSANSVFMWPLATLEDWDFPFRDGPEIRWRKLNPKERQKVIQAREIYKDELQKTRKSLTDFLARNPDTPEYEERTLVHLAIMGDFALWAKHSGLDEIYGAALRPE